MLTSSTKRPPLKDSLEKKSILFCQCRSTTSNQGIFQMTKVLNLSVLRKSIHQSRNFSNARFG
jgi:hypothetical protein